ncbi:hypothetical protein [Klebsiella pneumoniae]|uniref:hypothetical protein n=1 Tax=Klebsiella pneumoniae TaxID=573 RepID=UPI00190E1856|nr:hypothetical protein [Klebsiella pneumoniae]
MTDITELAQSLKAAADREMICRDGAETSEIWERTVTPENILALVEALEKAQTKAIEHGRTACELFDEVTALRQRIAELESRTVKLPKPISVLHRREFTAAHCAIYAYPEAEVNAALDDAGIKVEAE